MKNKLINRIILLSIAVATMLCPGLVRGQYPTPNLAGTAYTTGPFARHTSPLLVGQCTWYVYGRIQEAGVISPSTLSSKGIFLGNASTWPSSAISAGYSTGSQPRQGAIAVWTTGVGHLAFVESVVNGVAQFSECNATPSTASPNTTVVCRNDQDTGAWNVRIRNSPSTSGTVLGNLPKFNVFSVVGGPTSANGYSWYRLQGNGYDGWAALLDIDSGNAATANFSWSFTRVKLQPSSSSIAMGGSPNTYIYLSSLPSPSISSVSPSSPIGSNSTQPFYINGSNFVSGCNVTLRDLTTGETFANRTITSFSSSQIRIDPNFTTAAHTWSVQIINPDGRSSSQFQFLVQAPPLPSPSISSVSPSSPIGSNSTQPFYINGSNFVSGCNVTLRDLTTGETFANRTITSFSSSQIRIDPNFTTAAHTWSVQIINPDGRSSSQFQFSVISGPVLQGEPSSLGVFWIPSPNFENRPANQVIDSIVIHTVQGSYASGIATLTDSTPPLAQRVSAHYIISPTGEIAQLVDLSKRAWHATYYNDRSIGIEMAGYAEQAGTWTAQNLTALENLVAYLVGKYNIPVVHPSGDASAYPQCLYTGAGLVAHSQLQPGCNGYATKSDPGPYFPWTSFVQNVQAKSSPPRITGVGGGALQPPSNGSFQFEIAVPNRTQVTVQASGDMVNWLDAGVVPIVNGKGVFTDPTAGARTQRFYRTKP